MNDEIIKRIEKVIKIIKGYKKVILYNVKVNSEGLIIKEYIEKNTNYKVYDLNSCDKNGVYITTKSYKDLKDYKTDYYLLDFSRINTNSVYVFATDFEEFDFKKLKEEIISDEYEGIKWKNRNVINIGDTVYIYFFNIVDHLSRIMIKSHVIDDGFHSHGKTNNEYCKYNEEDENNTAIRIKVDSIFDNEESKKLFNINKLREYGLSFSNFHSKLAINEDSKLKKELDDFIIKYKSNKGETSISFFEKHFGLECEFKDYHDKSFFEYNHNSFLNQNGYKYYDIHHLIEQHNYKNGLISYDIVYDINNEIPLCSCCHDRIHKGTIEDRIKMVLYIYKKRRKQIDKLLNDIPDYCFNDIEDKKNKRIIWLLKQYVDYKYITSEVLKEINS